MPELGLFSNPYLLAAIVASVLLQIGTVTVPGVRHVFGVDELPMWDWWLIFVLALAPVTIIEVTKLIRARLLMRSTPTKAIMPSFLITREKSQTVAFNRVNGVARLLRLAECVKNAHRLHRHILDQ